MRRIVFLLMALAFVGSAHAQMVNKYWVEFTDKAGTPYTLDNPSDYLGPRALERRAQQGIAVDSLDLPVSPAYIEALQAAGFTVQNRSKWLNGVVVFSQHEISRSEEMKRCSDIQTSRHSESDNLEISPSENLSDIKEQQQPKTETTGIVSAISEQEFLKLDKKGVVVLEFYTTWCGPCRKQTTIMGRLAKDNPQVRFFKIDAEQAPQLDTQFRIDAVPVIIVFKDGQVTALLKGLQSKKVIEEKLMKLME